MVVVPGDVTQRAKRKEFQAAAAFLQELSSRVQSPDAKHTMRDARGKRARASPLVVTTGNHDVPLYRFWERALFPFGNFRRYIGAPLNYVQDYGSRARFVALSSAAPRTAITNGRLSAGQLAFMAEAFEGTPKGACRVLVTHHNLNKLGDDAGGRALRRAGRVKKLLRRSRVDLVLSGHIHRSSVLCAAPESPGTLIVHSGTASSTRGRGDEAGLVSAQVVRIAPSRVWISRCSRPAGGTRFREGEPIEAPRKAG